MDTFDVLKAARMLVDFTLVQKVEVRSQAPRAFVHLGAALADCVLQAGLNYRHVVLPRVERILNVYPEAKYIDGIMTFIDRGAVAELLMWKHQEKIHRFGRLALCLKSNEVCNTTSLRKMLQRNDNLANSLLSIEGIGQKTVDYLSCLVGIDGVAIDRHIRSFVKEAGVEVSDYSELKGIVCCAADILNVRRRDFDAYIWSRQAASIHADEQLVLL